MQEYRAALRGRILIMARNRSSHDEETTIVELSDGQRLVKLHYSKQSSVACDLIHNRAAVVGFLREFRPDDETSTSNGDRADSLQCVRGAARHLVDKVGGRVVDMADWNVDGINLRILRDDVQQNCDDDGDDGEQTLAAFMQILGSLIANSHRPTRHNSVVELRCVGIGRCKLAIAFLLTAYFTGPDFR